MTAAAAGGKAYMARERDDAGKTDDDRVQRDDDEPSAVTDSPRWVRLQKGARNACVFW